MLSTIERILLLRSADIFGAIAAEDLTPLAVVAEEVRFSAGEKFIRRGEFGDCLYVVVNGEVGVLVDGVGEVPSVVRAVCWARWRFSPTDRAVWTAWQTPSCLPSGLTVMIFWSYLQNDHRLLSG